MRKSHLYNFYVNPENGSQNTNALAEKYQFKSQFGDQVELEYFFFILAFFTYVTLSSTISVCVYFTKYGTCQIILPITLWI